MKGISELPSDQSPINSDHALWSISPTLTLTELPSGFSQLPSSDSLGLSANLPIASITFFLSNESIGILGTAQVASVHEDQEPLSKSIEGEDLERPTSGEISFAVKGP